MNDYQVEFIRSETFIVYVTAENEEKAVELADNKYAEGDYKEMGDCEVIVGNIYDVTEK